MTDVADKPQEVPVEETVKEPTSEEESATNEAKKELSAESSPEKEATNGNNASTLEGKIIRQVEYYFGDANLHRDKFLLEQISKNEDGWVPFDVLLTFKRLAALTTDIDVIVDALHKSDEGLVEISEDKKNIRRHPERPIPEHNEEKRKEIMDRTVYAKGFPVDIEMADILEFFSPFEKVANISMRKYLDKPSKTYKFKGSVFVTFVKKEQAEEFITKEKVQFKENDLIRKWQEVYYEEKKEERNKSKKGKKEKKEEDKFQLPKGTVLFFEGATDATTRELIRSALEALEADVAYIDYSKADKEGHIRLHSENSAAAFLEKVEDKKLKLSDSTELTLRTLTEEEEKEFLAKAIDQMKSRRNTQSRHKGGFNRKRRGGNERDEPRHKKNKD
ncbi:la protein homolog [Episyrphus balteatus]|uniref:la protein homolog n=1 Tax=Episyrphus balteatus TaxID=286459 RepID=UPI0024860614|nr:la protein homolog [Episyrphus balteatus]XP_055836750.1 la protein homolog [Episyrphus balteatus]